MNGSNLLDPKFDTRTRRSPGFRPALAHGAAVLLSLALIVVALPAWGQDWPQFRGPGSGATVSVDLKGFPHVTAEANEPFGQNGTRAVDRADFPVDFNKGLQIGWKVDLPGRGSSSPIVVRKKVIITASSGTRQDLLHVLAFDAGDGHRLWERQFWATGRTLTHPQTAVATPTPASDGQSIFAFFSSNDLIALDLDGNLLWYRGLAQDFPRLGNDIGMSSSPLVVGQTVVVQAESQGEAFVAGIDKSDGATRWQLDRERAANWTSPATLRDPSGATAVLIQSGKGLAAVDPANGTVLWNFPLECDTISSACGQAGLVFVPGKSGLTVLRAGAVATTPEVVWKSNQVQPGAASPAAAADRVYIVNRSGVLIVADAPSGKILTRTRLEGNFWSSPVVVGNRLLMVNFDGLGQLVEMSADGSSGKVIGKIPFGEKMQSSPALSAGGVFVRSDEHLWKLVADSEK